MGPPHFLAGDALSISSLYLIHLFLITVPIDPLALLEFLMILKCLMVLEFLMILKCLMVLEFLMVLKCLMVLEFLMILRCLMVLMSPPLGRKASRPKIVFKKLACFFYSTIFTRMGDGGGRKGR